MKKSTILFLVFIFACSHQKTASIGKAVSQTEKIDADTATSAESTIFTVKDFPEGRGCVRGCFLPSLATEKNKVYSVDYNDELNLNNTQFDIPVTYNAQTKRWVKYFSTRGRESLLHYLELSGRYAPMMAQMLEERGLPRDLIFLAMAESGFQNRAKSHASAVGPWQFISATGKKFGLKIDWYVDERRDPIKSTIAASMYLRDLEEMFGSWELAAAAYNAGEGKIGKAVRKHASDSFWTISQSRSIRRETKNYVPKIMALAIIGKNLDAFGFEVIDFKEPLAFEIVNLPALTDLKALCEKMEWNFEELSMWNPELIRWFTPPGRAYSLRVPVGMASKFASCCSAELIQAKTFQIYQAKKGISVDALAKSYRIPTSVLKDLNPSLQANPWLPKGDKIFLPFREGQDIRGSMYADLYERSQRWMRSKHRFTDHVALAKKKGKLNLNATEFYTVKKGDTLWDVSKRTGIPLDNLIRANLNTVEDGLRPGEKLAIR